MTGASVRRRSALHGRRGLHRDLGRAAPLLGLPIGETNPTVTAPTSTQPAGKDKNTPATSTTAGLIPGILSSILSPAIGSTTSKLSSSTTSTSSTSATTSSVTTSSAIPTTRAISVPTVTSSTPHVVVQTATRISSSTSLQTQTPSQTSQVSSGTSAVTVIAGIGGALLATILLTVIIGFFLRRWRKKRSTENGFEGQFRRSGVLLDEKDDNTLDCPRPPSMIERRNAASPPAAYPADEPHLSPIEHGQSFAQYGQSQYGAIPQHPSFAVGNLFGGDGGAPAMHYGANPHTMNHGQGDAAYSGPGEKPGYGAPPFPGIHGPGAYAPYGVDSRYHQSQRYPQPNQYHNQQPQQHQQRGFGQGRPIDTTKEENVPNLTNPFSPLRVSKKLGPTENSGSESLSTPTSPSSTPPPSTNAGTSPFVTRQSHETLPTYTNDGGYANVQRDVKMSPAPLNIVNGSSDTALPPKDSTTTTVAKSNGHVSEPPRPLTVYGDDDVYGGM